MQPFRAHPRGRHAKCVRSCCTHLAPLAWEVLQRPEPGCCFSSRLPMPCVVSIAPQFCPKCSVASLFAVTSRHRSDAASPRSRAFRGVQHGDPLGPAIFALAIQPVSTSAIADAKRVFTSQMWSPAFWLVKLRLSSTCSYFSVNGWAKCASRFPGKRSSSFPPAPLRKALRLQVALAVNGSHLALATSLAPSELPVKHTLNSIDNDDAQGAFCFAHALTAPRSSTHVGLCSPP